MKYCLNKTQWRLTGWIFYMLPVLITVSCGRDKEEPGPTRGSLESYEFSSSYSAAALQLFTSGLDFGEGAFKYNTESYKVTYYTTYKDQVIQASGVVVIPKTTNPVATVSFQHGTIASNSQAPSELNNDDSQIILASALASMGFIAIMPDFIGFGASRDIFHPYYIADVTVDAIVDNIIASGQLAEALEVTINNRLYLAGYSQGGYATMVTHEYAEETGLPGYELIASFPAAGGYDIKGVQEYFFAQKTYHEPFYLAYVAMAYKSVYGWEDDLSIFFNEPYASTIPGLFDGILTGGQINAQLTDNVVELLNPDFLDHEPSDPAYQHVNEAFALNSPINWIPEIPMYMFHGDADISVPYQNSVDVYEHFIEQGASPDVVTFTPIPGGTHSSGAGPYLESLAEILIALENPM